MHSRCAIRAPEARDSSTKRGFTHLAIPVNHIPSFGDSVDDHRSSQYFLSAPLNGRLRFITFLNRAPCFGDPSSSHFLNAHTPLAISASTLLERAPLIKRSRGITYLKPTLSDGGFPSQTRSQVNRLTADEPAVRNFGARTNPRLLRCGGAAVQAILDASGSASPVLRRSAARIGRTQWSWCSWRTRLVPSGGPGLNLHARK